MSTKSLPIVLATFSLAACSAVGQLTVKDYSASSGQRVMAGQAEPKSEFKCEKLSQDEHDWGLKGNMNRAGAIEALTKTAVEAAPGKGANYAYVIAPGEKSVGGFNVNAFSGAQVAYYKCASLPTAQS